MMDLASPILRRPAYAGSGHLRNSGRETPRTPRSRRPYRAWHNDVPRGVSDAPLAAPAPLAAGRLPSAVRSGFPTQPGYPSQPTSSRWLISDDRFDSVTPRAGVHGSPRTTCASPKPNFVTLEMDQRAWQGSHVDATLRGGKTFAIRAHLPEDLGGPYCVSALPFRLDPLKARVEALKCFAPRRPHRALSPLPPAPVLEETRAEREARLAHATYLTDLEKCRDELVATAASGLAAHEDMARTLAASVAHAGMRIQPRHIEAAVRREGSIDLAGKLAELLTPLRASFAIHYVALRAALPELCAGSGLDAATLEAVLVETLHRHLERSVVGFTTDELLAKVGSPADVVHLADEIVAKARTAYRAMDLDAIASLPAAPDKCMQFQQATRAVVQHAEAEPTEVSAKDGRLFHAAGSGDVERVRELLAANANVDMRNEHGRTPLILAARAGDVTTARVLLDAGAKVEATDGGGFAAIMVAKQCGHEQIVQLLLDAGAVDDHTDQSSR